MISSLKKYVINIHIHEIFEKYIKLFKKIVISNLTNIMNIIFGQGSETIDKGVPDNFFYVSVLT